MERIMTLLQISAKIDLRLNKGASADYDNIWNYVKQEAFNKAINEWVRRQYHGNNIKQEGDEETTIRVDDLQILLKTDNLTIRDKGDFVETNKLPSDYLYYKRLTPYVSSGNCESVKIKSHLKEEANVDDLLPSLPSFEFEETFHTLIGNRAHVYHAKKFTVNKVELTYYRKPTFYEFKPAKMSTIVEFKDDVCELLVDDTAKIIASDIESLNAKALTESRAESNN
jgi:hypothetical protein